MRANNTVVNRWNQIKQQYPHFANAEGIFMGIIQGIDPNIIANPNNPMLGVQLVDEAAYNAYGKYTASLPKATAPIPSVAPTSQPAPAKVDASSEFTDVEMKWRSKYRVTPEQMREAQKSGAI